MKRGCYINGMGLVSAQNTFETDFLENASMNVSENVIYAQQPSYKELIPPAMIRRMAKGVKMGIFASTKALNEASVQIPDAIITGTGMGCTEDSEKFLKAIIDNNEAFLTPTSFIQSTHNTVAAQIALGLQCKSYNFTYVNGAVSLESALLDAKMQLEHEEANSVLVGGVDETSNHTMDLFKLANIIKKNEDAPYSVLGSETKGVVFSEGASFFMLQSDKSESSYAEIVDLAITSVLDKEEIGLFVENFLKSNKTEINEIDCLVLGYNGDVDDNQYFNACASKFSTIPQAYFKHLSGEYNTASGFGLWLASKILKTQTLPEIVQVNNLKKDSFKKILLYNQYQGRDHSLILLQEC